MSGQQLISDQGLRLDGRRATELRRIRCKLGVFSQPDGEFHFLFLENNFINKGNYF